MGDVGDRGEVHAPLLQRFTRAGADRLRPLDVDRGGGPLVRSRQGPEGEVPLAGLAPRARGLGLAPALGEGRRLAVRVPRLLLQLGLQGGILRQEFLDPSFQRGAPGEHLSDERQERLVPQLCEFLERGHDADL